MAKALIGKCYDTDDSPFGILWRDFPIMRRRGGYSGPFKTRDEATARAEEIMTYWGEDAEIEYVENVNRYCDNDHLHATVADATACSQVSPSAWKGQP